MSFLKGGLARVGPTWEVLKFQDDSQESSTGRMIDVFSFFSDAPPGLDVARERFKRPGSAKSMFPRASFVEKPWFRGSSRWSRGHKDPTN